MKRMARCYHCNQAIKFDPKIRSANGKLIPLNSDKSKHDCPMSPYNRSKRSVGDAA
jgi:hypothetical protein